MQQFLVQVLVTVNTIETVSGAEVREYVKDYMESVDEDGLPMFAIGGVEIQDCSEV